MILSNVALRVDEPRGPAMALVLISIKRLILRTSFACFSISNPLLFVRMLRIVFVMTGPMIHFKFANHRKVAIFLEAEKDQRS